MTISSYGLCYFVQFKLVFYIIILIYNGKVHCPTGLPIFLSLSVQTTHSGEVVWEV